VVAVLAVASEAVPSAEAALVAEVPAADSDRNNDKQFNN
jgi:hypothetical protein